MTVLAGVNLRQRILLSIAWSFWLNRPLFDRSPGLLEQSQQSDQRMPKYKCKRPSLEDAHKFHKVGHWGLDHSDRFTAEEQVNFATAASEEVKKKCHDALPNTRNLELLILKCHVIIEFALESYIRALSAATMTDRELKLTFEEKTNVAYMMGLGIKDPLLLPSIELLNRIRNDIAHRLTVDEKKLDELIRINSDQYHEKHTFTLGERLRGLKSITWCSCGMIIGLMEGQVLAENTLLKEFKKAD